MTPIEVGGSVVGPAISPTYMCIPDIRARRAAAKDCPEPLAYHVFICALSGLFGDRLSERLKIKHNSWAHVLLVAVFFFPPSDRWCRTLRAKLETPISTPTAARFMGHCSSGVGSIFCSHYNAF